MAWKGVITNTGNELLAKWSVGETLLITRAEAGTGRVDEISMMAQTELLQRTQQVSILGNESLKTGQRLKLQITSHTVGYKLNQIGVWAAIGDGEEKMIALYQTNDDAGVDIPGGENTTDFAYTFFALLEFSSEEGVVEVTVDPTALVTREDIKKLSANDVGADPSGSAAAVQENLNSHTGNKNNPHSVTAADVGAATPADVNAAVKKAAPVNLLDNSDFRNPVNQRGTNVYTGDSIYTVDRWRLSGANNSSPPDITNEGTFWAINAYGGTASLQQRFPKGFFSKDKTYTLVWCDHEGNKHLSLKHGSSLTLGNGFESVSITFHDWGGIVWAALYEGEYTAETLPYYQPKGYAAELAECQRYYRILRNAYIPISLYNATAACATLFGFNMRITPTVNILKYSEVRFADGTIGIVSGIISADNQNDGTVKLLVNDITNANSQRSGFLYDWILELSADL